MSHMIRKFYRLIPASRQANSSDCRDPLWFVDGETYERVGVYDTNAALMTEICKLLGATYFEIQIDEKAFLSMLHTQGITKKNN